MDNKGLTIVEIIVAVLIVSIIGAGMFSAFVGAQYMFNRAKHRLEAFNFAREAQDKLRADYAYTSNPAMVVGVNKPEPSIGSILRGEMATLSADLTYDVSEPVANGYKKVTVKVSWTPRTF